MKRRSRVICWAGILAILFGIIATLCWYFDLGHGHVEKIPELRAKTMEDVTRELGEPDTVLSYEMGDSPGGEFRGELLNHYPTDRPENRRIAIRELWWRHSRFTVVVWFHMVGERWVVLNTCRWQKGVVF